MTSLADGVTEKVTRELSCGLSVQAVENDVLATTRGPRTSVLAHDQQHGWGSWIGDHGFCDAPGIEVSVLVVVDEADDSMASDEFAK